MDLTNQFIAKVGNRKEKKSVANRKLFILLFCDNKILLFNVFNVSKLLIFSHGTRVASSAMDATKVSTLAIVVKVPTRKFIAPPTTPKNSDPRDTALVKAVAFFIAMTMGN